MNSPRGPSAGDAAESTPGGRAGQPCYDSRDVRPLEEDSMATTLVARLVVTAMIALGALAWWPAGAEAQETIRIGCPTKTYFPTILATVAKEKGLFEKEGLRPEITIYRGGGETFEAIAANSADLGPVAVPLVATSRKQIGRAHV